MIGSGKPVSPLHRCHGTLARVPSDSALILLPIIASWGIDCLSVLALRVEVILLYSQSKMDSGVPGSMSPRRLGSTTS